MSINIGLEEPAREESVSALKKVLGETYALYMQTHGYHWNVTGPRFSSLHTLFETQYNELWMALDQIAERIRSLGEYAPGSSQEMMAEASIEPDNGVPDADTMVANLAKGHEAVSRAAKRGVEAAEKGGDVVTADLLTVRADVAEKTAWMLRSSL